MPQQNLKNQTKRGLYWTFLNQFATYGIQFIIGVVMARILSPDDYGITALPAVFISIAAIFIEGGLGNALIRKPELTESDLSTSFYYSLMIGVVCYFVLYFVAPYIAFFYGIPVLESLTRVTALSFLLTPLSIPQRVILCRKLDFKTPAQISIVTRLLSGVVGVTTAYVGWGLWALVISNLFCVFSGTIANWYVVRWIPKGGWSRRSFHYLWGYGNKLIVSSLIDTIYKNITPVFIGKFYTTALLGVYNRALGYTNLPSQQLTSTVRSVTFPVFSKIQDDNQKLTVNFRRIQKAVCFVVFPLMLLLAGLANPLVIVLLTEKWAKCVILLQVLCFAQMWYPIHAINLNLLQVKGRSDLFLRLEIIKKILGFGILALTLPKGVLVFCYGSIVFSLIELVIDTYYTEKFINVGLLRQIKDFMPSLLLSVFVFVLLQVIIHFVTNMVLQIFIGGVVGIIIYMGIAYILEFSEIEDVRYMLKLKQ